MPNRGGGKKDEEYLGVPYKSLNFQQAQEKIVEELIRQRHRATPLLVSGSQKRRFPAAAKSAATALTLAAIDEKMGPGRELELHAIGIAVVIYELSWRIDVWKDSKL